MRPRIPSVGFGNVQLSSDLDSGIDLARIINRDLQRRIFDLLGSLHNALHRKGADLARVFVELRAQVFLRLVVLARRDNNRVFHRADHNLRIDALLSAESVNCVVELACHKNQFPVDQWLVASFDRILY